MTILSACAPVQVVDGPVPVEPPYNLLRVGQLVTPPDDRYLSGVSVWGYAPGGASTYNAWDTNATKVSTDCLDPPKFIPFPVYMAQTWPSRPSFSTLAEWEQRVTAAFSAVRPAAIEHEFLTGEWQQAVETASGDTLPNRYLSDANADVLNGGAATNAENGLALLEREIAKTGKLGMIHVPPDAFTALAGKWQIQIDPDRKPRTRNGNLVVPGFGYVNPDGVQPAGTIGTLGATEDWIYATGIVQVRVSQPEPVADQVYQILDRHLNRFHYIVEGYAVVAWDGELQAAVRIDRCATSC